MIGGASPQAESLFVPENGDGFPAVAQALQTIGFDPQQVKLLGTGVWNEPRVFAVPALQGAWFATPDNRGFNAFAARYRGPLQQRSDPARDTVLRRGVTSAAALARMQGSQRFTESVLTNPSRICRRRWGVPVQGSTAPTIAPCRAGNPQCAASQPSAPRQGRFRLRGRRWPRSNSAVIPGPRSGMTAQAMC